MRGGPGAGGLGIAPVFVVHGGDRLEEYLAAGINFLAQFLMKEVIFESISRVSII